LEILENLNLNELYIKNRCKSVVKKREK